MGVRVCGEVRCEELAEVRGVKVEGVEKVKIKGE